MRPPEGASLFIILRIIDAQGVLDRSENLLCLRIGKQIIKREPLGWVQKVAIFLAFYYLNELYIISHQ